LARRERIAPKRLSKVAAISHVDPLKSSAHPACRRRPPVRYPSFDRTISKGRAHLATSSIRATRSPRELVTHSRWK